MSKQNKQMPDEPMLEGKPASAWGVICPSCDEHFLIDVVDITARAALVAAHARIAELEAALRFYAESPALGEIARAVLAGDEPAKE